MRSADAQDQIPDDYLTSVETSSSRKFSTGHHQHFVRVGTGATLLMQAARLQPILPPTMRCKQTANHRPGTWELSGDASERRGPSQIGNAKADSLVRDLGCGSASQRATCHVRFVDSHEGQRRRHTTGHHLQFAQRLCLIRYALAITPYGQKPQHRGPVLWHSTGASNEYTVPTTT